MTDLLSYLESLPPEWTFDGETYEAERDHVRLKGQLLAVYEAMKDGRWRTLPDLEMITGGSQAALSARLRDLRKEKFGAHTVERRHVAHGLFEYRLILNKGDAA